MNQRDDNNLLFVAEIEKYEYLYNFNMPEYNRKDITDGAWGEIAKKMGLTVSECKEKWRNIRSAFLRSLKQCGGRSKRPYYLSKELNFVLPYTKPHSTIQSNNDEQSDSNIFFEEAENADESNPETREYVGLEFYPKIAGSPLMTDTKPYIENANFESHHRRRRKRSMTEVESTFLEYIKCKKLKATAEGSSPLTHSPLEHFFLSLMPDIESMTNEQVRRFKIEVMLLIDKIKSNGME
ncbi:hypothetical protein ABMA27_007690 [Loxostege sticticalis]|uniref:Transcription factor Adf-1 n=1 Tax=Loxostege sticticalis TaxID=481309 RepID=A0ABR3HGQ0_LOXSC